MKKTDWRSWFDWLSHQDIRHLVREIVRLLVDDRDAVIVLCGEEDGVTTVHVSVAVEDIGKLIGRHGQTVRSLRAII